MKRTRNQKHPTSSKSQKRTSSFHENDDPDRLSIQPDSILHQIMSYLPTKDAARTSVLCKKFNSAWKSCPVLNFSQYYFQKYPRKNSKDQRRSPSVEDFCEYVDKTIADRDKIMTSLSKFRVVVSFKARDISRYCKNLDRWLKYAIENNVQDLSLQHHLNSRTRDNRWRRHVLPESLYLSKSLESLDLFGCEFIPHNGNVGLVSLKKLKLSLVYIDQETLQNILSTCSRLEELEINLCEGFQSLKVSGPNLKKVELYLPRDRAQSVVISAPNVKSLSYGGGSDNVQSSLAGLNNFQSLDELILHDTVIIDGFFRAMPEIPHLEKMEMTRCCFLENVRISTVRVLRCFSVIKCFRVRRIELHFSSLGCFMCNGTITYESAGDLMDVRNNFKVVRI